MYLREIGMACFIRSLTLSFCHLFCRSHHRPTSPRWKTKKTPQLSFPRCAPTRRWSPEKATAWASPRDLTTTDHVPTPDIRAPKVPVVHANGRRTTWSTTRPTSKNSVNFRSMSSSSCLRYITATRLNGFQPPLPINNVVKPCPVQDLPGRQGTAHLPMSTTLRGTALLVAK